MAHQILARTRSGGDISASEYASRLLGGRHRTKAICTHRSNPCGGRWFAGRTNGAKTRCAARQYQRSIISLLEGKKPTISLARGGCARVRGVVMSDEHEK